MKFEWDETKRESNLQKHGLDFADAEVVFQGAVYTFEDDRFEYGEQRYTTISILQTMIVVISHAESDDTTRVISMRRATKHEQRLYFQNFTD